jgi:peptide subunit release factor 1 (eRF1)
VVSALATGAIEVVIVNDGVPIVEAELSCPSGHLEKKFFKIEELEKPQICPEHKQPFGIFGKEDAIDALREIAKNHGARVEVVSKEIREGQSLWALGGIGAILRYRLS